MARVISNSILDCRLSGSIGDKVFYVVNGKQYMKAKPVKGTKVSKPKSAAQLEHTSKFGLVVRFLQPLRGFLKEGFKSKSGSMSAFNAAFSYCIQNSITGTYPDYQIDYPQVLVSRGPVAMVLNPKVNSISEGQIEVGWENNSFDYEARVDDKVMLLVYNPAKQQIATVLRGNQRFSESQVIKLPSNFIGDELHFWIAFEGIGRPTKVSDSVYIGSLIAL